MAAGDLCSLADVKAWLEIPTATTTSDALLTNLITRSSKAIKDWLARDLISASFVEKYSGTGTTQLAVANYPITAISSLKIDGITIPASPAVDGPGYAFKDGIVYLQDYGVFEEGNLNVEISYTAGLALPASVEQACIELVGYKYNQKKHIGKKSDNMSVGGMGTTYQEGGFPPEVLAALQPYRKVTPT